MDSEIISALIQAAGTVIAALIAVISAKKIVKDSINSRFHSYSDQSHDLRSITQKAHSDIFIAVAVGDRLLEKYYNELERRLKAGIYIRYLLLDNDGFQKLEQYMHGNPVEDRIRVEVMDKLASLSEKYPALFEVRIFHEFMTASYIGVDIWPDPTRNPSLQSSVIQTMLYQYHVSARDCPITYVSPSLDEKHYKTTVSCMMDMWQDADKPTG